MKPCIPMMFLLILIAVVIGVVLLVLKRHFKLSQRRARKIEILGNYFLFIVLVWEFILKNLFMGSFYNADLFYIDQKLNYIFSALNHIAENGADVPMQIVRGFYDSKSGLFIQRQLLFVDVAEVLLKIGSTVCIAVGRFYELSKVEKEQKTPEDFQG